MCFAYECCIELPYDSAMPFLGMYLKEFKLGYNRDTCIPMFIHNSQIVETAQMPYN
jgi:hypothetical protein